MPFPFHLFPYTNLQDLNLSWLLQEFRKLENFVKDTMTEFSNKLDDMQAQITKIDTDYKAADEALQNSINSVNSALSSKIAALTTKHNQDINTVNGKIAKSYQDSVNYTDTEIAKVKALINNPKTQQVFNYFRQTVTSLQEALKDYYRWLRDDAITCKQWEEIGLTWAEIDAQGLTVLEWDLYSRKICEKVRAVGPYWMRSPWDGSVASIRDVVAWCAQFHTTGLTTGTLDAIGYTAQKWDDADNTAYDIDWTDISSSLEN